MAKPKVSFKLNRIAEGEWQIIAEYPGVEDRYINPLGFQVQRYQRNAEALNPEPASSATAGDEAAPGVVPQGGVTIPAQPAASPTPRARRLANGVELTL